MPSPETRLYADSGSYESQKFQDDCAIKGQSVTRIRSKYVDANGFNHPIDIKPYVVLLGQQREFYIHTSNPSNDGNSNKDNDGLKHLLFPPDADVVENDMVVMNGFRWVVSRAGDPFVVNDVVTYLSVQLVRETSVGGS